MLQTKLKKTNIFYQENRDVFKRIKKLKKIKYSKVYIKVSFINTKQKTLNKFYVYLRRDPLKF